MNQRFLELRQVISGQTEITVTAPVNANCPPGQYLLFVLDAAGIPSVGRVITITIDFNTCPPVLTFAESVISQGKCHATVRLTASGTNLGGGTQWHVNGTLQGGAAGQPFVDIPLTYAAPFASYALEVTPPCGGTPVRLEGVVSRSIGSCTGGSPTTP